MDSSASKERAKKVPLRSVNSSISHVRQMEKKVAGIYFTIYLTFQARSLHNSAVIDTFGSVVGNGHEYNYDTFFFL